MIAFFPALFGTTRRWQWMAFQPQGTSSSGWIDARPFSPCRFIAATVDLAMMATTQRDRELIADFAAKRP